MESRSSANLNSQLHRRQMLKLAATGLCAPAALQAALAFGADGTRPKKSAILLWMDGGPSQTDTFDPKPRAPAIVRGEYGVIDTTLPGVQFSDRFPQLAKMTDRLAVVRSMSTGEDDHGRARIYMHTGYRQGQAGLTYPGIGSIASAELGRSDFALPNFVTIGAPQPKYDIIAEPGYLGWQHGALVVHDPERPLEHVRPATALTEFQRREKALREMDAEFANRYRSTPLEGHRSVFERAVRLMGTELIESFDIQRESTAMREQYGQHTFGRSCLLARRLIETGVPLVEVYAADWDSHERRRALGVEKLMPEVDQGSAALIADLAERGMLDQTLVIWMGEFGRTPRMNKIGGRDHFPDAWNLLLAGAGIRGGQVLGRTDKVGEEVVDRPISTPELLATFCRALGIDPKRKIDTPLGRPVPIVDEEAQPIRELFS